MDFVTAADGLRLAYDVQGDGAPLLCLPGLTRNMEDFEPVLDAFAHRARVIRMDFRGRGASDWAVPATYQVPQEAADVLTLLDHLGLPKVTILGTSRGGLVALVLAAMARPRIAGVIFNDIGPEVAPEGLAYIMDYLGKPPKARTLAEAAAAFPATTPPAFTGVPPETWAAMAIAASSQKKTARSTTVTTPACATPWPPPSRPTPRPRPLAALRRVGGRASRPHPRCWLQHPVRTHRDRNAPPPPRHGLCRIGRPRPCPLSRRT